jgi:WS/DGAT/MGAT family acyltransferase
MAPDPPTPLRGPLGHAKRVAWSRPLDLEDFRRIGRVTGSTVNDVLLAALAGGLRRILLEHGLLDAGVEIRGVVPVNLRRPSSAASLGNHFGLAFVELPVGLADPLDRVFAVRRRTAAMKDGPEASVTFEVLRALGVAPRLVFDRAVDLFGAKATLVVTNVAGPRAPVTMGGACLRRCMFFVPSAGRLALGVSLLSYAGRVFVGVQSDAGVVAHPERLVDGFLAELDLLLALDRDAGSAGGTGA